MSTIDRPSNIILDSLNRLHFAKLSGGLNSKEFADEIVRVGDLTANCIKNGKITDEQVEEIESHLPSFSYFKMEHKDLDRANRTFKEGNEVSLSSREMPGRTMGLKM